MCVPARIMTCSYAIEKHARVPNEPFDAEEDAANFEVELVDCSSFSVCFTHSFNNRSVKASNENLPYILLPSLPSFHSTPFHFIPPLSFLPSQTFQTNTPTTFNTTALALRASLMLRLAGGAGLLLLLLQLLHALLVGSGLLARVLASQLHGALVGTLVAQTQVGHQTLDHELADVVLLAQTEQLADVARTLRTQAAGLRGGLVGQTRNLLLALLHDHQVQHADVGTHDAATHGLALTLTLHVICIIRTHVATSTVAGHTVGEEQTHAVVAENSLLHGETLLVVSSSDAEK